MEAAHDRAQRWVLIFAVLKYWSCDFRVNFLKTLYMMQYSWLSC
jgi:hypothetical protein